MSIRVFHRDEPTLRLPLISKDARFVVWPGTDAWNANMNYVVLEPGEANVPHIHEKSEDSIFILEGEGLAVDYTNDVSLPFHAGCVVHVPAGIKHAIVAGSMSPGSHRFLPACQPPNSAAANSRLSSRYSATLGPGICARACAQPLIRRANSAAVHA